MESHILASLRRVHWWQAEYGNVRHSHEVRPNAVCSFGPNAPPLSLRSDQYPAVQQLSAECTAGETQSKQGTLAQQKAVRVVFNTIAWLLEQVEGRFAQYSNAGGPQSAQFSQYGGLQPAQFAQSVGLQSAQLAQYGGIPSAQYGQSGSLQSFSQSGGFNPSGLASMPRANLPNTQLA